MHDDDTDIADIEVDITTEVECAGGGGGWGGGCSRQRKYLVIEVLIEGVSIGEQEVPRVNIFLNRLKRGNGSRRLSRSL